MAVDSFTFTSGDISDAVDFDGVVKIVFTQNEDGDRFVKILQEEPGGAYGEVIGGGGVEGVFAPRNSANFYLKGSYKVERSATFNVGYVA